MTNGAGEEALEEGDPPYHKEFAPGSAGMPQRGTFWLAPHVYACRCGELTVLLDLRADRYFGLGGAASQLLAGAVSDWPMSRATGSSAASAQPDANETVERLLSLGILVRSKAQAKSGLPCAAAAPTAALLWEDPELSRSSIVRHGPAFLISALRALVRLRLFPIEKIVHGVQKRKQRCNARASMSEDSLRELVSAFEALLPLLFTSRHACLFHALALIEFLAAHGAYPQWVFGVRTAPFAAHCWVQQGSVVLNDVPENVTAYTPIMVV